MYNPFLVQLHLEAFSWNGGLKRRHSPHSAFSSSLSDRCHSIGLTFVDREDDESSTLTPHTISVPRPIPDKRRKSIDQWIARKIHETGDAGDAQFSRKGSETGANKAFNTILLQLAKRDSGRLFPDPLELA